MENRMARGKRIEIWRRGDIGKRKIAGGGIGGASASVVAS